MSYSGKLVLQDAPAIAARNRLQFEPQQRAHVLLYPEGMIKLSDTAAEILKRVDGAASIAQIITALEQSYPGADLREDVLEFLETAYERGWISFKGR
jgi:pyrroloquinoline quinone biosynthesis protein D